MRKERKRKLKKRKRNRLLVQKTKNRRKRVQLRKETKENSDVTMKTEVDTKSTETMSAEKEKLTATSTIVPTLLAAVHPHSLPALTNSPASSPLCSSVSSHSILFQLCASIPLNSLKHKNANFYEMMCVNFRNNEANKLLLRN